ncbi:hypothetical protein CKM354_000638700 [Cercospora kikuchii]|uniref:Enoyl reductase (ER) domain-containing protein n=1 Tax=Cercospora kikuchii TaxID=84275 RepID=A0A9P3CI23_9PEZI|nr:uncharacterized protein CKM354_000638700 [Cercospora kikuchii]GIZ43148.1 hypothetical protein CKM354_000638700 [Cercospora kikuchii]
MAIPPTTMFAWRKHQGNETPQYDEVPVPKASSTGFLCKMLASGVCHSDQAMLKDTNPRPWFHEKYILGHEGCGQIIEIGKDVTDTRFKVGDVIAMFAVPGCGQEDCTECSRGTPQLCLHGHHSGIGQDGFFAPYATIDQRGAVLVPQGVSPLQAAVATDAVATAYHAVHRRAEVNSHETVLLFGLGGLGFNGLQVLKSTGARVIVSEVRQERLDAAVKLGIPERDIVPIGTSVQDFVKQNGLEEKIDTTIDFVGLKQTFEDAQQVVRRAGKMVCIGTLSPENTISMKVGVRKRLSILFSYGAQVGDLEEVLQLIARGAVQPDVEQGRLEDFPQWLQKLCHGKVAGRVALCA